MPKSPTLSIVVPVYKVEKYLAECLDSILASSFSDFEILLVDDGSPDQCPAICDEYAKKDTRIKVVHKENGGLSSARNAGLTIATGKYVGFVDSDDRILPEMYAHMIASLEQESADIVCCGMRLLRDDGIVKYFKAWPKETQVYPGADCLWLLLSPDGCGDFYMNKLFRKEFFEGFRLPEGKQFEDIYSMHLLFEQSQKTVFLPEGLYEYRLLPNSLSHSKTWAPRFWDYVNSCKCQYEFVKEKYPRFLDLATQKYVASVLSVAKIAALDRFPDQKEVLAGLREELLALGDDLAHASEKQRTGCALLQKGVRTWIRRCRALRFYESKHNQPRVQAILKPFIKP